MYVTGSDGKYNMYVKIVDADPNPEHYMPPDELFVERVMVRFEKRRGMWIIATDIGIYIMFTFLLLMMSLIQRHPHTFDLTEVVENMFVKATFTDGPAFEDVRSRWTHTSRERFSSLAVTDITQL